MEILGTLAILGLAGKGTTMLLIASDSSRKTYYDLLSVKEDASYDEIRSSYKAAVLNSHPDKLKTKSEAFKSPSKFLEIQKAWEVLSESNSRANYDKQLLAFRHEEEDVVADEIRLEEMSVETADDAKEFFYQCRCGDYFSVSAIELEKMGISSDEDGRVTRFQSQAASVLLPCGSCSIKIRLILDISY